MYVCELSTPVTLARRPLVVCVSIILGCTFAYSQEMQQPQTEPRAVARPGQVNVQPQTLQRNPYVLTREQSAALTRQLSSAQRREVSNIARDIANGRPISAIQTSWSTLVEELYGQGDLPSAGALAQQVLMETFRMAEADARRAAEKARRLNQHQSKLRHQIEQARAQKWQTAQIKSMEVALATVGEDAQLANIDLQNQLQKQQQTLQTLSNVSKMLHDTAMAIIRKIG